MSWLLGSLFHPTVLGKPLWQENHSVRSNGTLGSGPSPCFERFRSVSFTGRVQMSIPPAGKGFLGIVTTSDRVQSYVRPFGAAQMAAGPDEIRRSDPNRNRALEALDTTPGVPISNRPYRHHLFGTLPVSWTWSRHPAAMAGLATSWRGSRRPAVGLAAEA